MFALMIQDLDLREPGVRKPNKRFEFETRTADVLREADFRVCMIKSFNVISCHSVACMHVRLSRSASC